MRSRETGPTKKARDLRNEMSLPEVLLWRAIRGKQLGIQVRRQYPVGPHVLDFYVPKARLCIEIDGQMHDLRVDRDIARDALLTGQDIATMRIEAARILKDLPSVVGAIEVEIQQRLNCFEEPS